MLPRPTSRASRAAFVLLASILACAAGGTRALADPLFLPASAQGSWVAADKQLHFTGSLAIAASLRITGRTQGKSLAGAVGLGVLKEVYDATLKPKRAGRGASWKDLAADILGAVAGVAVVAAIDR